MERCDRIRYFSRPGLLVVDEISYVLVVPSGGG
jgi:hypothetical protein